jgi:cathepsin E
LTLGTLIPGNSKVIPTVTDNLFEEGKLEQKLIAVSFDPISGLVRSGELMFGTVDTNRFTGNITYVYVCAAT